MLTSFKSRQNVTTKIGTHQPGRSESWFWYGGRLDWFLAYHVWIGPRPDPLYLSRDKNRDKNPPYISSPCGWTKKLNNWTLCFQKLVKGELHTLYWESFPDRGIRHLPSSNDCMTKKVVAHTTSTVYEAPGLPFDSSSDSLSVFVPHVISWYRNRDFLLPRVNLWTWIQRCQERKGLGLQESSASGLLKYTLWGRVFAL